MESNVVDQFLPSDGLVIVVGITGSGKSTFISALTDVDVGIGHGLRPYTSSVRVHTYVHNDGRRVHLIDTPGFNDDPTADVETLKDLVFYMTQIRRKGANLVGLVCLHPISINRVSGSSMRMFRMLEELCGNDALDRIALVTSMWNLSGSDTYSFEVACRREEQLIKTDKFWGSMLTSGSLVLRFLNTKSSALSVVDMLIRRFDQQGRAVLKIQHETLEERTDLLHTSAARVLAEGLAHQRNITEDKLRKLVSTREQVALEDDIEASVQLESTEDRLQRQLQEIDDKTQCLGLHVEDLVTEKEAYFTQVLSAVLSDQEVLRHKLEDQEAKCRRLEEEKEQNSGLYHDEEKHYREKRHSSVRHCRQTDAEMQAIKKQYYEEQQRNKKQKQRLQNERKQTRAKLLLKRNIVPVLQMLGGIGCMAGGIATGAVPVAIAGAGLFGAGVSELSGTRDKKAPKQPRGKRSSERILDSAMVMQGALQGAGTVG